MQWKCYPEGYFEKDTCKQEGYVFVRPGTNMSRQMGLTTLWSVFITFSLLRSKVLEKIEGKNYFKLIYVYVSDIVAVAIFKHYCIKFIFLKIFYI